MVLSEVGEMVKQVWYDIPRFYHGIGIDEYVVMPDHFHGIIIISDAAGPAPCGRTGAAGSAPCGRTDEAVGAATGGGTYRNLSLSDVIHRFKSMTTHKYFLGIKNGGWPQISGRLWQSGFYDVIIRNEQHLEGVRRYIRNNPANWE